MPADSVGRHERLLDPDAHASDEVVERAMRQPARLRFGFDLHPADEDDDGERACL